MMQQRKFAAMALASSLLLLGGCASNFIDVRAGSDRVSLAQASQVGHCKPVGKTTVSVTAKVGIYNRSIADVDADLLQLARNDAVDIGGDTVVASERPDVGKRVFLIYRCRP